MLRPYLVDPSRAAEVALRPREGEVIVSPPAPEASEGPVALVLGPSRGHAGLLVPLGRGWSQARAGVTVEIDDLVSDVMEPPLEAALEDAADASGAPVIARLAGRVTRAVTDALRAAASLPPYEAPRDAPRVALPEAVELVAAVGSYPDDFAFFRLERDEHARCTGLVARVCAAMGFDRLSGVQFGLAGAVAGVVLARAPECGAPEYVELLWFAEEVDELEARNASRPPELRAGLVRDGGLTVAIYPDVPEIVALAAE